MDEVMREYRRDLVTREWAQNDTFDKMVDVGRRRAGGLIFVSD